METRAHHIIVGLFTLTAGALLLLFTMWMSRSGVDRNFMLFDILFEEAVSGLSVGSPVQYSGIRVGEVERLRLDPLDPRLVWARVRISSTAPVKVDTTARLTLLNVTGASGIELSQGLPSSALLTSDQGVPVIHAEPSSFARLRVSSDELLASITSLLDRANNILSDENAQNLSSVLRNLDSFTASMVEQEDALRQGLDSLANVGNDLSKILERIDDQITTRGEPLMLSANNTAANLEQFSQKLDTLLSDNGQALSNGMQSLSELGPAIQDLRGVLGNLSDITTRLEEDPAGFFLGGDNIKEFQP
ncbi:MAG: MlaD family protein [Gammaproteobacteria bacterium]|nr:MlaD family protein [Gammaproteobacteria bacterium]MDP2141476.1 MlaD family protein [Gammaproteobacteria bacterium]MDP2347499.1 MlaD family protein [Gammaproteobacteria bacterium]